MRGKHSPRPTQPLSDFHGIYTVAPQMLALFERLPRVACSGASVLIRGETGTGKELVARALHLLSPRKKGHFEALNCATLTGEILASELFGLSDVRRRGPEPGNGRKVVVLRPGRL